MFHTKLQLWVYQDGSAGKGPCESDPRNPNKGGRREPVPQNYPLMCIHVQWHAPPHTFVKNNNNKNLKIETETSLTCILYCRT